MAPMLFYCRMFGYRGVSARFIFSFRLWLDPVTQGSYVADKSHCRAHCWAWLQPGMLAAAQCPVVSASLSAQQLSFLVNMSSQGLCISASERSRKGLFVQSTCARALEQLHSRRCFRMFQSPVWSPAPALTVGSNAVQCNEAL